jgi:hypothetical protein
MVAALGRYWLMRDRYADAVDYTDQALSLPGADAYQGFRVRALCIKARCLWWLGRRAEAPAALTEAEAIARAVADPVILSQALQTRADYEANGERLDACDALADEALYWATMAGDEWEIAGAARGKARAASTTAELRERVDRAATLLENVGSVYQLAHLLAAAAYEALCMYSDRDAKELVDRALPIARELDNPLIWMFVHGDAGVAALMTGDTEGARDAFSAELRLCREAVVRPIAFEGLLGLGAVAAATGEVHRAARLVGAASAHCYDETIDVVAARIDAVFLEPARTRHGADAWDAAARDAATLSFEDAIAYALQEPLT